MTPWGSDVLYAVRRAAAWAGGRRDGCTPPVSRARIDGSRKSRIERSCAHRLSLTVSMHSAERDLARLAEPNEPLRHRTALRSERSAASFVGSTPSTQARFRGALPCSRRSFVFRDPANPGNAVRVMPGNPSSPYPRLRGPYVRVTRNGQYLDNRGRVVPRNSPDGHIPLSEFRGLGE
jgi:hypothetical protein